MNNKNAKYFAGNEIVALYKTKNGEVDNYKFTAIIIC